MKVIVIPTPVKSVPWNKGKLAGAKPPLRPKHVWSIRTKLQIEGSVRDVAMFNLALESKLSGCDVVAIRVEDVAASGYLEDRATVRQKKTGRPVRFELSELARQATDDYLKASNKRPGEYLFTGRSGPGTSMRPANMLALFRSGLRAPDWTRGCGTHSVRRTKATLIYRRAGNLRAVQLLLGHTKIESTVARFQSESGHDRVLRSLPCLTHCRHRGGVIALAETTPCDLMIFTAAAADVLRRGQGRPLWPRKALALLMQMGPDPFSSCSQ